MKIVDAKKAYSAQLDSLWSKKQTLTDLLKEGEKLGTGLPDFDRVEISKELSVVDKQYEETRKVMESISAVEMAVHNAETARQQNETVREEGEELAKIMVIMRRIMAGDKVPPQDEKKLMEFDGKLYMMAKSAAMLVKNKERKEHDSLWKDEDENPEAEMSAEEIAANTEIAVPSPGVIAAAAAKSATTE